MKHIIVATNRPQSNSRAVAGIVQNIYRQCGGDFEIFSLTQVPFQELLQNPYPHTLPPSIQQQIDRLNSSSGWVIVCPEYNGSFPGIFKFFIDHWNYPKTFDYRPICFVGLGGRFGALRPVEQLQQILGYHQAFIYPQRVFLQNISELLKEGKITDPEIVKLLHEQARGFLQFISALEDKKLTAATRDQ